MARTKEERSAYFKKWYAENKERIKIKRSTPEFKQKVRERYAKDPQKYRDWHKKWIKEHPEKVREHQRKWIENNQEKVKNFHKKYYEENKEKIVEAQKKWAKENKEYLKKYRNERYKNPKIKARIRATQKRYYLRKKEEKNDCL